MYIADFVAFYLLPNGVSTVLRAKRAEKVCRMLNPNPNPNPNPHQGGAAAHAARGV